MPDARTLNALLRQDFSAFVQKAFVTLRPGEEYIDGWYIQAICHSLHEVMTGQTTQLIINLPPRTLKSMIASIALPAYVLGHDPCRRIVCVSYSDELALEHARQFRRIMTASWYRQLFPTMQIDPRKNTEALVATSLNGFRLAASIGGSLTGRGGDLIIIDDPIKAGAAQSEIERKRVFDWYTSTLVTRRDDPARSPLILVMQRVHAGDLSGALLESGDWVHLRLPAIADSEQIVPIGDGRTKKYTPGECLEPRRFPKEALDRIKNDIGNMIFAAQYMQDPIPSGGNIIRREYFNTFDPDQVQGLPTFILQSWDVASKPGPGNDYSVCVTIAFCQGFIFVLDVLRVRVDFPDLIRYAHRQAEKYQPERILIEDANHGTALFQTLRRELPSKCVAIRPTMSKESRVHFASAKFENRKILFSEKAPWRQELEIELLQFPNGRYDDQVDALVQAVLWINSNAAWLDTTPMDPDSLIVWKDEPRGYRFSAL